MAQSIIFLGRFIPPKLLLNAAADSKGTLGFSNHNFEMSLIHGLCNQDVNLSFISLPGVFSYPRFNRKSFIHKETFEFDGYQGISIGYWNLVGINKFTRVFAAARAIIKAVKNYQNNVSIIINTPNTDLLLSVDIASKILNRHIDTTLIIPDIPSVITSLDQNKGLRNRIINIMDHYSEKLAGKCDRLVLLTEQMKDFFPKDKPYMVMEGIVDVKTMDLNNVRKSDVVPYFLYTGTLRKIFGVMDLVNAFEKSNLPDNMELWICGSGDAADDIRKRVAINPKIKFLGLVDSKQALELQHNAFCLVNPRTSEGEFTKYSFPSKTMEYLLSGNPVIAHKLPGIPDDYDKYLIYPDNETISALAKTLFDLAAMPVERRTELGRASRDFVISEKNSITQTRRILDFINQ